MSGAALDYDSLMQANLARVFTERSEETTSWESLPNTRLLRQVA
jgi:hypothetical protein